MSNVEGQQSQEPVAPILHTENAPEAVVQEAAQPAEVGQQEAEQQD